jgi:uncharacterized protein with GYD domain
MFVTTFKFSDQGAKNVKDTVKRSEAFKAAAKKMKAKIVDFFWTLGPSDGLVILEAPDEETATALALQTGSLGNIHTQTARAFRADEMEKILKKF